MAAQRERGWGRERWRSELKRGGKVKEQGAREQGVKEGENYTGNERKRGEEDRGVSQTDAEISVVKWKKSKRESKS